MKTEIVSVTAVRAFAAGLAAARVRSRAATILR
jgi:hypothetical protein